MKLLRTIRLDPSDAFVFTRAAEPGEWAVPGTFLFWERPVETLIGKERAAFRSGLLGISSFGWSTLATIVEVTEEERASAVEALAQRLLTDCGAPDLEAARAAAEAENRDIGRTRGAGGWHTCRHPSQPRRRRDHGALPHPSAGHG